MARLKRTQPRLRARIVDEIQSLTIDPYHNGNMRGYANKFKARIDQGKKKNKQSWRLIYSVHESRGVVELERLVRRSPETYQGYRKNPSRVPAY